MVLILHIIGTEEGYVMASLQDRKPFADISSCECRHDFTVVETIDFYADEDAELPPPMSQRDVIQLNRVAQQLEDEEAENGEGREDGKVDFQIRILLCRPEPSCIGPLF